MCRFLSADFELTLRCPIDKLMHNVRFQEFPGLRGHAIDVVACDAACDINNLICAKNCRALLESSAYWRRTYPVQAIYARYQ